MSLEDKILYAFATGEVAQAFWGRSDLSKYELGAALVENHYVDYKGGVVSRSGSKITGPTQTLETTKLARFQGTVSDYLLVFTPNKLRFIQNNSYILETAVTVTAVSGITFTSAGHGYAAGDLIKFAADSGMVELEGRYFTVNTTTPTTFTVLDEAGAVLDTTGYTAEDGTETAARVYTVATPYADEHIYDLDITQRYNEVRLTHIKYERRKLKFNSATNWVLSIISGITTASPPSGLTGTPSGAGTAGVSFAVTSVNTDGSESVISPYLMDDAIVNYTSTAGSYTVNWEPEPGAVTYNVYRSFVLPTGTDITQGMDLAYVGTSTGTQFTDNNIVPDFTKTPPIQYDPFAVNVIETIEVTAKGSGYAKTTTMALTGVGTGFVGHPVVNNAGEITGVKVVSGGYGYTTPTVTLSNTGGGTGATFSINKVGVSGKTHPSLWRVFQQRGVYFATEDEPASIWASQPGKLDNYDYSTVVNAGDGYSFTFDATAVRPIKSALVIRNGMLVFTDEGITQLRAESGKAVSATNALAEPQVYTGVSDTPPVAVDLDVLFLTKGGVSLNSLLYTEYTESFQMQDLSVLASHLLSSRNQVTRMVPQPDPFKLIWMPREDGTALTLTHVREQEVFGWSRHTTYGNFRDFELIEEADGMYLYQVVERYLRGRWVQYIERVVPRKDDFAENYWGVDCGAGSVPRLGDCNLTGDAVTGEVNLTTDANFFSAADVGNVLYYAGGKIRIDTYTDPQTVVGTYLRDANNIIKFGKALIPRRAGSGDWEIYEPIDELSGLWHLEGEKVSINFDGDAQLNVTVSNGKVPLTYTSTKVKVGLPYSCRGATLPLVVPNRIVEGQDSKIFGVIPRVSQTRGLAFGDSFDELEEMEDRSDEDWGEELGLRSDVSSIPLNSSYTADAQIFWEQKYPLPATLLGFVARIDVGEK